MELTMATWLAGFLAGRAFPIDSLDAYHLLDSHHSAWDSDFPHLYSVLRL